MMWTLKVSFAGTRRYENILATQAHHGPNRDVQNKSCPEHARLITSFYVVETLVYIAMGMLPAFCKHISYELAPTKSKVSFCRLVMRDAMLSWTHFQPCISMEVSRSHSSAWINQHATCDWQRPPRWVCADSGRWPDDQGGCLQSAHQAACNGIVHQLALWIEKRCCHSYQWTRNITACMLHVQWFSSHACDQPFCQAEAVIQGW